MLPTLSKLPVRFYSHPPPVYKNETRSLPTQQPITTNNARLTGVIAHELLQWACDKHPTTIDELPWGMVANRFKSAGFATNEQNQAIEQLSIQLTRMFSDPIGQWLCQKHEEERNEYELLISKNGQTATRIIDRTFLDGGCRWIIDFKTGKDDTNAQEHHRQQVNDYASLLSTDKMPSIHCGLFYLSTTRWINWDYSMNIVV